MDNLFYYIKGFANGYMEALRGNQKDDLYKTGQIQAMEDLMFTLDEWEEQNK